jgi:DNA polymerase-3 subunit alpha
MGKKKKEEMDAQRSRFVEGCAANAITPSKANDLFDLIDKFAGYGFNKSHAAAYALLAYHTAWLKAHYPHEFYAASMSFDMHQTDKLSVFVDDARRLDVAVAPPCVNASEAAFSVESAGDGWQVRYALGALKGVGERAMEELVRERASAGPFRDLEDFAGRVDPRLLNRRQLEALAGGGALDCLEPNRAAAFAGAETVLAVAASAASSRASGQGGLFAGDVITAPTLQLARVEPWSIAERMAKEKDAFGFYFSAHPVERYSALTAGLRARSYGELAASTPAPPGERRPATMAALVENIRWRTSQRGNRYLLVGLSDRSGQFQASCFDDHACEALERVSGEGGCALLDVELDWREGEEAPRVAVRSVRPLDMLMAQSQLVMTVTIDSALALPAVAALIGEAGRGRGTLSIALRDGERDLGLLCIGDRCAVDQDLVHRCERINGVRHVRLEIGQNRAAARPMTMH